MADAILLAQAFDANRNVAHRWQVRTFSTFERFRLIFTALFADLTATVAIQQI